MIGAFAESGPLYLGNDFTDGKLAALVTGGL